MILDLGITEFDDAYILQRKLVCKRKAGIIQDSLLLLEHPAVFTIGRSGSIDNLIKKDPDVKVIRVDRGGDITFHGPGQILAYPIFDLKALGLDLHAYMRLLESVGITFLNEYGIAAGREKGRTGIWVGDKKIASIGISASGWVSFHGMSINLNVSLGYFSMIHPCGMKDVEIVSLESLLGGKVSMHQAKYRLAGAFSRAVNLGSDGIIYAKYQPVLA